MFFGIKYSCIIWLSGSFLLIITCNASRKSLDYFYHVSGEVNIMICQYFAKLPITKITAWKVRFLIFLFCFFISIGFAQKSRPSNEKKIHRRDHVGRTKFWRGSQSKGCSLCFEYYAADEAVIRRTRQPDHRAQKASATMIKNNSVRAKAWWTPDHIDVSPGRNAGLQLWSLPISSGAGWKYQGI